MNPCEARFMFVSQKVVPAMQSVPEFGLLIITTLSISTKVAVIVPLTETVHGGLTALFEKGQAASGGFEPKGSRPASWKAPPL